MSQGGCTTSASNAASRCSSTTTWSALRRLLDCAFICNNAKLDRTGSNYRAIGDPTESALVFLAEKAGIRGTHQRFHLNPFESVRKRMSVVVKPHRQLEATIYVKGAPLETLHAL